MVQTNPLCRLDKPNNAGERQVEAVTKRFDDILSKLDILQQRVNIQAQNTGVQLSSELKQKLSYNFVIHASPDSPPWSLAMVLPLLSATSPTFISTHVHSSVTSKPSLVLNTDCSRSQCPVKLTLIYKDVKRTSTIIAPGKIIFGESNLMRLL